jgi:hypothetical protein
MVGLLGGPEKTGVGDSIVSGHHLDATTYPNRAGRIILAQILFACFPDKSSTMN